MTSSQTSVEAQEETTIEKLRKENSQLRTKMNAMMVTIEQLKSINDKQKDEIGQLTTLLKKVGVISVVLTSLRIS